MSQTTLQDRYTRAWLGRTIRSHSTTSVNGKPVAGQKIVGVEWVGNSTYGHVLLTLENGVEVAAPQDIDSFKPRVSDLDLEP